MFCPKCATQNNDGAKFCRVCGLDISLVPQAMAGPRPPEEAVETETENSGFCGTKKRRSTPNIGAAIRNVFMGVGFLCVALALAYVQEGRGWWFWLLIPAFSMLGGGVAEYARVKSFERKEALRSGFTQPANLNSQPIHNLPQRRTSELVYQPASITEGTTRHLGAESPTKVFAPVEHPKQES